MPFSVHLVEFLNNSAQPGLKIWVYLPFPSLSPFLPFFSFIFNYVCVDIKMSVCAQGDQKKISDAMELGLQVVVNSPV